MQLCEWILNFINKKKIIDIDKHSLNIIELKELSFLGKYGNYSLKSTSWSLLDILWDALEAPVLSVGLFADIPDIFSHDSLKEWFNVDHDWADSHPEVENPPSEDPWASHPCIGCFN